MKRFLDKFISPMDPVPGEVQRALDDQLPSLLAGSNLHLWRPGQSIYEGRRFLVGIATYSELDWQLLDALNNVPPEKRAGDRFDVFNFSDVKTVQGLERYIAGLGHVFHTPVVGHWQNGVLEEKASGAEGRKLLVNLYGLTIDVRPEMYRNTAHV